MSWISTEGLSWIVLHFELCCSAHPVTESQTGLPDRDLKIKCPGSCVNLKVCASPESPPAKSRGHHSVALRPEPMQSFWLLDCFLCFLYIPLAFVKCMTQDILQDIKEILSTQKSLFLYLCSSSYFIHFLFFSGLASPKKQHISLFYPPKLLLFPKWSHMQT